MTLSCENVSVRFGDFQAVQGVSFSVSNGQWWMIAGPNGAGKSTLLGAISQSLPYTGCISIDGSNAAKMRSKALSEYMGMLSQNHHVGYGFTVEEVVRLGRYRIRGEDNEKAVEDALTATGLTQMRKHSVLTLSGGELQRTFLAQLLAQSPKILLLDEPTNHLDIAYQMEILRLIQKWLQKTNGFVISVVHDLSLAKLYGTHVLLMQNGKVFAQGKIDSALSKENCSQVYGVDVAKWMRTLYGIWAQ